MPVFSVLVLIFCVAAIVIIYHTWFKSVEDYRDKVKDMNRCMNNMSEPPELSEHSSKRLFFKDTKGYYSVFRAWKHTRIASFLIAMYYSTGRGKRKEDVRFGKPHRRSLF